MASLKQQHRGKSAIVFAGLLIAVSTLLPQSGPWGRPFNLCISCGTYGTTNLILNAVLFVPLGAALWRARLSQIAALAVCLVTTCTVELLQLFVIYGRDAALGDILSNIGGGMAGWLLAAKWTHLTHPKPKQGMVLSACAASLIVALSFGAGWLFQASPTAEEYFGQIAPDIRRLGAVDGAVTEAMVNGRTLIAGPLDAATADAIREGLARDSIVLEARLALRQIKQQQLPIVRIPDAKKEENAALSIAGSDAVFTVRTRATDFALFQPRLVLRNAFTCDSCAGGVYHDPLQVRAQRTGSTYTLRIGGGGLTRMELLPLSGNMAWLTLAPVSGSAREMLPVTLIWLAVQFFLLGYWSTFAFGGMHSRSSIVAVVLTTAIATQLILPATGGTAFGSLWEWFAIISGAAAGALLATRSSGPGFFQVKPAIPD